MYGPWFAVTFGGIFVVLLIAALVLTAWTPIFAVLVALIVAAGLVLAMSRRRRRSEARDVRRRGGHPSEASPAGRSWWQ